MAKRTFTLLNSRTEVKWQTEGYRMAQARYGYQCRPDEFKTLYFFREEATNREDCKVAHGHLLHNDKLKKVTEFPCVVEVDCRQTSGGGLGYMKSIEVVEAAETVEVVSLRSELATLEEKFVGLADAKATLCKLGNTSVSHIIDAEMDLCRKQIAEVRSELKELGVKAA